MIKKGDEIYQLICISSYGYAPEELTEFTLGYYSSQEKANEQKDICEKQAEEDNLIADLQYRVEKHYIIL